MASFIWPPQGSGSGSGITSINGDSTSAQLIVTASTGTDFTIVTSGGTTTVAIPTASASNRGLLSSADWSIFNSKQSALTLGNLTDAGTDGITVTGGTGAVVGSGTSLSQHVADTSHNGYLSSADWNTFSGKQSALTIGNLTDAGTDGITIGSGTGAVIGSGTTISQHVADASHNGYLSSADWSTFSGKQSATLTSAHLFVGNGSNVATDVAMSGDATLANTGALTLATVNTNTGSFGSSTAIPTFTVNGKGLITAASTAVVVAPAGTLSGTTLNSTVVTSSLTTVGTIGTGTWAGTAVAIAHGGTGQTSASAAFNALSPMTTGGDIIYGGASGAGTRLANGSNGQVLTSSGGTSAPTWTTISSGGAPLAYYTGTYPASNSNYWYNEQYGGAYGNYLVQGTIPSPTVITNVGFTTPTTTSGTLPGITFTAPYTGVLEVAFHVLCINSGGATCDIQLWETTTSTALDTAFLYPNSTSFYHVPLYGFFSVTASTSYTIILRGAANTGNNYAAFVGGVTVNVATSAGLSMSLNYIH